MSVYETESPRRQQILKEMWEITKKNVESNGNLTPKQIFILAKHKVDNTKKTKRCPTCTVSGGKRTRKSRKRKSRKRKSHKRKRRRKRRRKR